VIGRTKKVEGRRMGENLGCEDGKSRVFMVVKQMKAKNKDAT